MNTFSERLRLYRKQANLTQKGLAEKAGIAEINVRQYEAGKFTPKLEAGKKIANALGVSLSDLMGWEDNKPVKPIVNVNVSKIMGCLYFNCGNCDNQLRSFAKYCDQCGKPIDLEAKKKLEEGSEEI